jgi:hypothetical protein
VSPHRSWQLFLCQNVAVQEIAYTRVKARGRCLWMFPSDGGICTGVAGRRQDNHTSFLFMSSLLYCGIQSEYGTKNTTQIGFKNSFQCIWQVCCGLVPTVRKVPNTINITRCANQCHPTPTAVRVCSLFADCDLCWESRSLSNGWVRRIRSVL